MNEETKEKINAKYQRKLHDGERFWPDSIFKDVIVSLGIFVLLIVLATFIGVHDSPKADPSDTSYIPRPEWYFLFLFKFLALYGQIPVLGKIEFIATVIVPGVAIGVLVLLPFIEKSPYRYYGKRILPLSVMGVFIVSMVTLTLIADIPTTSSDAGVYIPGISQIFGGLIVPGVALLLLFIMAFTMKDKAKKAMIWTAGTASVLMVIFTVVTLQFAPAAAAEEEVPVTLPDRITAGQDLYSVHCVECHGDDGSVAIIEGVEGLEGEKITPINSKDVLYTLTDSAMQEVIAYGRPNEGMPPFGLAYGGELTRSQIDYIITFMRYAWDDRFEMPPIKPLFPALAEGEVPSYDVHIAPIVKRYCISCHRAGKENNNYLMTTYDEILTTGDHKDNNVIAGDENSYLLQVIRQKPIIDPATGEEIIGVMPPKSVLKQDVVDVWTLWIMNGMPKTAEDAAALSTPPTESTEP